MAKSTKSTETSADKVMMDNLAEAIEAFSHLQLMFHAYHKFLKAIKFGRHDKFEAYGEMGEHFVGMLMRQVYRLGGSVQYDAGTITAPDINASPSSNVESILKDSLEMVNDLAEQTEAWQNQALLEAREVTTAHDYKDMLHKLYKMSIWLAAQNRWSTDLGAKEYAAAGEHIG